MVNAEISRQLLLLAEMLELVGGKDASFRVRALRAGAQAIAALAVPAAELAAEGKLIGVKDVGEGIVRRVRELASTGRLAELDEIRSRIAPGLVELMHVEGVGPRTAMLVYERLGVASLDELEEAARAGKLRDLPRLGRKKEEQILRAIARTRQDRGRIGLERAEGEIAPILEQLGKLAAVLRLEVAGSLRRRRDTVADADILVGTNDPRAVTGMLVKMREVAQVLASGLAKTSVRLESGLQVDVRMVSTGSYGAALHYFTGSKAHNVAIRTLGVKRGLKINEYGVFEAALLAHDTRSDVDSAGEGRRIGGATEEEVFSAVGLPWIPPELREDRGEIEAAFAGRLPKLLEMSDIRGDLHVHTTESDGRATLEEMVETAARLGREYLAITDHSQVLKLVHGLDSHRLRQQARDIRAINERFGGAPLVLRGIEADILADGSIDLDPTLLGELDWVIGSVHSHFRLEREQQTSRIVKAMESGLIDVVGHPTGRVLEQRQQYSEAEQAYEEFLSRYSKSRYRGDVKAALQDIRRPYFNLQSSTMFYTGQKIENEITARNVKQV
ncbi:MAG: PHP domain-containing protein, partial [Pseudomonadota bacterium]